MSGIGLARKAVFGGALCLLALAAAAPSARALDNGLAPTPPMGWNDWNAFHCDVNEQLVEQTADAIVDSGMKALGYRYVNIDDCWMASTRAADGSLRPDPVKFPNGIKAVADYVHAKGLKLGIYEDSGFRTCAGFPGSFGYERQDAAQFAAWGVDYLKYDWCNHPQLNYGPDLDKIAVAGSSYEAESPANTLSGEARTASCSGCSGGRKVGFIGDNSGALRFNGVTAPSAGTYQLTISYLNGDDSPNGTASRLAWISVNGGPGQQLKFTTSGSWDTVATLTATVTLNAGANTIAFYNPMTASDNAKELDTRMRDALQATGRSIVYSICNGWDSAIQPWLWAAPVGNLWRTTHDISDSYGSMLDIYRQNVKLAPFGGPNAWNDPDMLEVGNGGMSDIEYRAHFSLWAEMAAPLIAGTDLRTMSAATKAIYTNRDVIAVDQDPLGEQGTIVSTDGTHDAMSKRLANGDRAVVLFNQGGTTATFGITAQQAGLPKASAYRLHDLWSGTSTATAGAVSATVPAHGVVMYRVSPTTPDQAPPTTTLQLSASPASLSPGQSTRLEATFTNDGRIAVSNVSLSLDAPAGWDVQSTSQTTFGAVRPGASVRATWSATAPGATQPIDSARFTAAASYVWGDDATPASAESEQAVQVISPVQSPFRTFASTQAIFGQLGSAFAIDGDGTDVWTGNDEYGSIYLQGAAGSSTTATVQVTRQEATDVWAKAGIMFRNDVTGAGRSPGYVMLAVTPGNGFALQWDANGNGFLDTDQHTGTSAYPCWLRLVRNGSTFTASYSTDGTSWHMVGTATVPTAAATQDVAMFSTSHSSGTMGEADFRDFGTAG